MKKLLLSVGLTITCATITFAQTNVKQAVKDTTPVGKRGTVNICTVSRAKLLSNPPLYIIYADNNKIIYRSDTAKAKTSPLSVIKQEEISSMDILKDSIATQRFGKAAMWGVIEIHLTANGPIDQLKNIKPTEQGKQQ